MRDALLPLPSVGELVTSFVAAPEVGSEDTVIMRVESLEFDLPVEIEASMDGAAIVAIGISPPTQIVRTTVMPVFHRLRLTIREAGAR